MITTAQETAAKQLTNAIADGSFDDVLDTIEDAIKARKRAIDASMRTYENYPVGSKVRFNERVSPKYLMFSTATVVSHNRSRGGKYQVEVTLDYPNGKFRAGTPVKAMFAIIDPVK